MCHLHKRGDPSYDFGRAKAREQNPRGHHTKWGMLPRNSLLSLWFGVYQLGMIKTRAVIDMPYHDYKRLIRML